MHGVQRQGGTCRVTRNPTASDVGRAELTAGSLWVCAQMLVVGARAFNSFGEIHAPSH